MTDMHQFKKGDIVKILLNPAHLWADVYTDVFEAVVNDPVDIGDTCMGVTPLNDINAYIAVEFDPEDIMWYATYVSKVIV